MVSCPRSTRASVRAPRRWPHVNLLYPFLKDDAKGRNFAAAAVVAEEALTGVAPFTCSIASFAYFKHAKSCTVWLHPADADADADPLDSDVVPSSPTTLPASRGLMEMQAALQAAFSFADDLSTISPSGFTPHLSVGQWWGHNAGCSWLFPLW